MVIKENLDLTLIDYLSTDYLATEEELLQLDRMAELRIEINQGLEEALQQLQNLKNEYTAEDGAELLELCKNTVIETITGQFGLASMFIENKDGGNITTVPNFVEGITANQLDRERYVTYKANQNTHWIDVRKKGGYDDPLPGKRKQAFQTQDVILDEYTGKPLPKDGRAHLDHVVSASEIEKSAANNLFLSPEQRAEIATNEKNLAWTNSSSNQSKGDKSMGEWLSEEDKKTGHTKAQKYDIDENRSLKKDQEARHYVNWEINKAKFKKYSSELIVTGGSDAAKMAAYSAIGIVLRDFVQGVFCEIKKTFNNFGHETLKEIFSRFKTSLSDIFEKLKDKWKDILTDSIESSLMAFFSNLLVFIINLFATTLKKIVTMIRAGFVSLVQAIKMLTNPPADMPSDEVKYQAFKILTAGLIGAGSLGLGVAIEKFLQAIPGLQPLMLFPIPSLGGEPRTVSDILSVTLSALAGGILTTITLYFLDKFRSNAKKDKLQIQLIAQGGVAVEYSIAQTWFVLNDGYEFLKSAAVDVINTTVETDAALKNMQSKTLKNLDSYNSVLERKKALKAKTVKQ